ncbi:helix-turn-helix domain-containing protein [Butyrivibrio sp. DSM 10294]|uniref:helix-turn-helix domain-containing protein n=1 Tax=Butyrivibrio sp. DSM 10294 TaxID=2972457 RepID=UPI00234EF742|nr:helix-turn-helix transcriptional regulator [Butyrivibrio sp. DSM 10294]MDC7291958.1 helix-turn-helix domain-containing protein [Butyrivibrio sp. DSM 10294]
MDIGNKILFLRKNKGVTQEQLAQTLGVSNQAVSKWESGQCFPDIQLLPDIARYFNVSSDELLGIETQSSNDDILITINDVIQNSKPGTEMAQIMKIAKALHAIVLVKESKKESSGYPEFELDETIEHAICNEWGLSSVASSQIITTMRRGNVFFSDDQNLYDENSIKKICKLMKKLSDKLELAVLFAVYDITVSDEATFASVEQVSDITDLQQSVIESILDGELVQFLQVAENRTFRIRGEYMNIPPILSVLYPAV